MSIDRMGAARQSELQGETRKAEDQKKGAAFGAFMKDRARAEGGAKKDAAKKGEKAEGEKKTAANEQDMADRLLGSNAKAERAQGKGEKGEGGGEGEAGGKGGVSEAGEGGEALGGMKGSGKSGGFGGLLGKGKAQAKGKGELGKSEGKEKAEDQKGEERLGRSEGAEKREQTGKAQDAKTKGLEEASKTDKAKEKDDLRRQDRPNSENVGASDRKDDAKALQDELAKKFFPGEVAHPFLMQQIQEAQIVEAPRPVIPPEVIDKVVAGARFGMNADGAHEFQIDLKQDVLGGAQLKISTKDGKVNVEVLAKDAGNMAELEAKASEIAKTLSERGLNVQNVNVSLASDPKHDAGKGQSKGRAGAEAARSAQSQARSGGRGYDA